MTPDVQRQALALLTEVWALSPDVRLGHLFAHLGFLGEAHLGKGHRHRAELIARLQGQAKRGRH
jgi:hypothetical protein